MNTQIFDAALGMTPPWYVSDVDFDQAGKTLTLRVDFKRGSRFAVPDVAGEHPVHDTVTKRYRHLNFFQHECFLEARVPRVKLPDGKVRQISPDWAGRLSGFTLLFEALVVVMAQQMTFSAVARLMSLSVHRVMAICECYVDLAVAQTDLSEVSHLAIDETSRARGHDYLTLAADADQRRVIFVTEGRDNATIEALAGALESHGGAADNIESASIDMSPAFIKGVEEHLPNAWITFDKFHVIAHASAAVDKTRRAEQKNDPELKGTRWALLKDRRRLTAKQKVALARVTRQINRKRTARAWLYREELREILARKQPNVVSDRLWQWCTNVNRSKVEAMKEVAAMIRNHFDGIIAWTWSRQTNGFLEALNGLFQAAKRKARGYTRFRTARMVIFLLAGKLDFRNINPYVHA